MEKVDEIDEVENLVVGFLGIRRPGHVTGRTQVPALVYFFSLLWAVQLPREVPFNPSSACGYEPGLRCSGTESLG